MNIPAVFDTKYGGLFRWGEGERYQSSLGDATKMALSTVTKILSNGSKTKVHFTFGSLQEPAYLSQLMHWLVLNQGL